MGVMGGPVPPESTQKFLGQMTSAQLHELWGQDENQEGGQNEEAQNIEDQSTEAQSTEGQSTEAQSAVGQEATPSIEVLQSARARADSLELAQMQASLFL